MNHVWYLCLVYHMAEKGDTGINNMVNITKKPNRENYLKMTMI